MNKLLTTNSKIDKSMKLMDTIEASILQLLPSKHTCNNDYYKNCIANCLSFKGMAKVYPETVINGRMKRTKFLLEDSPSFMLQIKKEITNQINRSLRKDKECAVRLNGFSDIDFSEEKYFIDGQVIFNYFYEVMFWDYTKNLERLKNNTYKNYHLTYSYVEATSTQPSNIKESLEALRLGFSVAIIDKGYETFETQLLKDHCPTHSFTDGDLHDFRWMDDNQSIVILKEKI